MIANHSLEPTDAQLFDALVDGELTESRRTELLQRLDRSIDGWRQLSLAFLEAQSWRQAFHPVQVTHPIHVAAVSRRTNRRAFAWLGAWAASTLLAFSVGLSVNRLLRPSSPSMDRAAASTSATPRDTDVNTPTVQTSAVARTLSPAARQQLERLGFRVQERPRVVSVQRSDGQTVQVLINEVELHFVGRQYSL